MTSNPAGGGSSGSGFAVHPDTLRAAGQNAQAVAGRIPDETKGIGPASDTGVAGLAGWESGQALHDCTAAWQTLLTTLSGQLDSQGQNLVTTAQNYSAIDSATALALTGAGSVRPAAGADPFVTVLHPGGQ
ncbi:type VII secretion target [Kitasatospora sp. NBC_01287]|uniref:type VII secretion target n=1 Tax=Kitasatospora sp. NBC_01287 TaxID=2903573 RepID=UPI002250EFB4|nr:type VII secretion target [Kitasatospora sp. NBC_01287]MCX4748761.1 type VII secretion target [Kitasatospora sp. NBC_01287]